MKKVNKIVAVAEFPELERYLHGGRFSQGDIRGWSRRVSDATHPPAYGSH